MVKKKTFKRNAFKRKFKGKKRNFSRKRRVFSSKLMTKQNFMNFFGLPPVMKRLVFTQPIYLAIPANNTPVPGSNPPSVYDGYTGFYCFGTNFTANAATRFPVYSNLVADPAYDQWSSDFSMIQIKAVQLKYINTTNQNNTQVDTTHANGTFITYAPRFALNLTTGMNAPTPSFTYQQNKALLCKVFDQSKIPLSKTYALPSLVSSTDGVAANLQNVWGSSIWYNIVKFNSFVATDEYIQPMVYLGYEIGAQITTQFTGTVSTYRYYPVGTMEVMVYALYACDAKNTF